MSINSVKNAIYQMPILLMASIFIPFWHLQRLVLRNKKIWLMGAWYGNKYSDNCRSLFEYINNCEREILPIWLSRSVTDINYIRSLGFKAYHIWSFWGVYYSLRAGIVIYSSTKDDINKYFINGAVFINLWHAAPFKKVEQSITCNSEYALKLKIYKIFFPWLYPYGVKHTIILSRFFSSKIQIDFGLKEEEVFISGFPRNDNLFSEVPSEIVEEIKSTFPSSRIIMYMPTFRDYDNSYNYFLKFNFNKFQKYLEKTNSIFLFKRHYASKIDCDFSNNDRIIDYDTFSSNQELYLHIKEMDVLITDYSSIFYDFLLLDKPILLTPFDLDQYINFGRELHYSYEEIVPGPICKNWDEVLDNLNLLSQGELAYQENIKKFKKLYHKYQDNKSSKRVFSEIYNRYLN